VGHQPPWLSIKYISQKANEKTTLRKIAQIRQRYSRINVELFATNQNKPKTFKVYETKIGNINSLQLKNKAIKF